MKRIIPFVFSIVYIFPALAQAYREGDSDGSDNSKLQEIKEINEEINRIKKESEIIFNTFEIYQLEVIQEEYDNLNENIENVKAALQEIAVEDEIEIEDDFYTLYNSTVNSYSKLVSYYDFYLSIEDRKDSWGSQYFRLWETTYALRSRIDQLYVKEENMNMHYGGLKDYKYESVRKRNIYESCTEIYNIGIMDLKHSGDCDYYDRIQILNKLEPVMRKCEKLAYQSDTRTLEKQLKKTEDPELKIAAILDFILE